MSIKTNLLILIATLFISLNTIAQNKESKCLCSLLENNKENDEKVIALGEYIEASFHEYKADGFKEKFNIEAFGDLIMDNDLIDKNDAYTKGFISGLKDASSNLSNKIVSEIQDGTYYNLISYEYNILEHSYYLTFRIYSEETGINYHDYKVCTDGVNVMFSDIYIYITGEHISKTFQRVFLTTKPKQNSEAKNNPIFKVVTAQQLLTQGNHKAAYDKLSEIEGDFAKEKIVLIIKGLIASSFDDELYKKVLEEFAELYPKDPTLYLKQIDYYILKEDYTKAIDNIDLLLYETEDDFLSLLKAGLYLLDGDYENADTHYKYMIENYPNLIEADIGYVSSLSYQNKFNEAVDVLEMIIEKGYEKELLADFVEEKEPDGNNVLESLVNSDAYKQWKNN